MKNTEERKANSLKRVKEFIAEQRKLYESGEITSVVYYARLCGAYKSELSLYIGDFDDSIDMDKVLKNKGVGK